MQRRWEQPSIWHAEVYYAAFRCQAAALSLTPLRLHGLKMACPIERQKTGWYFASQETDLVLVRPHVWRLSRRGAMKPLGCYKDRGLIALLLVPQGKDDPYPYVGEGTDSHRMTFTLSALALVIVQSPVFPLGARLAQTDAAHYATA
jgi:hypothetical protein